MATGEAVSVRPMVLETDLDEELVIDSVVESDADLASAVGDSDGVEEELRLISLVSEAVEVAECEAEADDVVSLEADTDFDSVFEEVMLFISLDNDSESVLEFDRLTAMLDVTLCDSESLRVVVGVTETDDSGESLPEMLSVREPDNDISLVDDVEAVTSAEALRDLLVVGVTERDEVISADTLSEIE